MGLLSKVCANEPCMNFQKNVTVNISKLKQYASSWRFVDAKTMVTNSCSTINYYRNDYRRFFTMEKAEHAR